MRIYKQQPAGDIGKPDLRFEGAGWAQMWDDATFELSWDVIAELEPMLFESDRGERIVARFERLS
jgi:hypothetical protein